MEEVGGGGGVGGYRGEGEVEITPYFTLPAHELKDVIAPSCYSCFDYTNALADVVVGYMAVPHDRTSPMRRHPQSLLVRNPRGWRMLRAARRRLHVCSILTPTREVSARARERLVDLWPGVAEWLRRHEQERGRPGGVEGVIEGVREWWGKVVAAGMVRATVAADDEATLGKR